ncbi:MAG: hypothetical protein R2844_14255 [Caldilineales bacterium]
MNNRARTTYPIRSLALVVGAIIVNIALGYLVRDGLRWPVYLDSIGTILVGALLGPLAGAVTGALSNVIWSGLLGDRSICPLPSPPRSLAGRRAMRCTWAFAACARCCWPAF